MVPGKHSVMADALLLFLTANGSEMSLNLKFKNIISEQNVMKAYCGGGSITLRILDLGTRWK
jgi:hypothetical protein